MGSGWKEFFFVGPYGVAIALSWSTHHGGATAYLDLRKAPVRSWMRERMLGLLQQAGIGYLKMDYNETVGIGPDGPKGPTVELRAAIAAAQAWVQELRQELPDLVIECCARGASLRTIVVTSRRYGVIL